MEQLMRSIGMDVPFGDAPQISNIDEWLKWASAPRTEEEIREKCLTDFNNVCFSFLCEKSELACDFIEELMLLSTGILTKDNYDEMHDKVYNAVMSHNKVDGVTLEDWGIEESKTHIKASEMSNRSGETRYIHSKSVNDRIDWRSICKYQRLTEDFMRKFNKCLDWKEVKLNQKLSEQFKKDFKKQLSCKSLKINHI